MLIHKEEIPMVNAAADKMTRGFTLFMRNPRIIKPENPPKNCDKGIDEAVDGSRENIPEMSGRIEPAAVMVRPPANSSMYRINVGSFLEVSSLPLAYSVRTCLAVIYF